MMIGSIVRCIKPNPTHISYWANYISRLNFKDDGALKGEVSTGDLLLILENENSESSFSKALSYDHGIVYVQIHSVNFVELSPS